MTAMVYLEPVDTVGCVSTPAPTKRYRQSQMAASAVSSFSLNILVIFQSPISATAMLRTLSTTSPTMAKVCPSNIYQNLVLFRDPLPLPAIILSNSSHFTMIRKLCVDNRSRFFLASLTIKDAFHDVTTVSKSHATRAPPAALRCTSLTIFSGLMIHRKYFLSLLSTVPPHIR